MTKTDPDVGTRSWKTYPAPRHMTHINIGEYPPPLRGNENVSLRMDIYFTTLDPKCGKKKAPFRGDDKDLTFILEREFEGNLSVMLQQVVKS